MKKDINNSGFTLVEMLVAISILLIAVVGPLSIVAGSIGTSNLAKEQITAHYLAQEAIELVRNIKDNNRLDGNGNWLQGLTNCSSSFCKIDTSGEDINVSTCNNTDCDRLYVHESSGVKKINHSSSGGTPSIFARKIKVESYTETEYKPKEAKVTVEIRWRMPASFGIGSERTFSITEWIYDW